MLFRTSQPAGASLLHRSLPPNLRKVLHPMKTFTNANMFCPDPEKAGPAMITLPLVALEDQFGAEMEKLGIRFLSLTNTPVENMEEQILDQNPRVLLTNVESLNNSAVQRKISKLKLSYIAIDEAQVNLCNLTNMTI